MMRPQRRLFRAAVSVALLGAALSFLPRDEVVGALRQAPPLVLALAVATFLAGHVAAAYKWRLLMGPSIDLPLLSAIRAHFTGLVGTLSPLGMIGGDVVRAGVALNGSARRGTIVLTSVIDRAVDTAALLALGLGGYLWLGGTTLDASLLLWGGLGLVTAGGAGVAGGVALLRRARHPAFATLRDAAGELAARPWLIVRAFVISLAVQATFITINAFIGASVGVDSPFAAWVAAWPAAKFAAYLPIGIAGIGIREAALVALMRPLNGAAGPVMAAGLLWDAVLIVGSVGGWLALHAGRASTPAFVR